MKNTDEDSKKPRLKRILDATDKKALKKSFWGSLSRFIGVVLGSSTVGLLHKVIGDQLAVIGTAAALAIASFILIWFSEYEREKD